MGEGVAGMRLYHLLATRSMVEPAKRHKSNFLVISMAYTQSFIQQFEAFLPFV
jgi:hypothetical protein